eukprot:6087340-Prymnesium_polylepis.1
MALRYLTPKASAFYFYTAEGVAVHRDYQGRSCSWRVVSDYTSSYAIVSKLKSYHYIMLWPIAPFHSIVSHLS